MMAQRKKLNDDLNMCIFSSVLLPRHPGFEVGCKTHRVNMTIGSSKDRSCYRDSADGVGELFSRADTLNRRSPAARGMTHDGSSRHYSDTAT